MVSQTDVIHESGKCTERHSSLMFMVSEMDVVGESCQCTAGVKTN